MKNLFFLLVLTVTLVSCECCFDNPNTIYGRGIVVSEDRYVGEFTKVESQIAANIEVIESDEHNVTITVQKNLLPYIDTDVKNGTLEISSDGYNLKTDSTIVITIYTPSLNEFRLTGVGNVNSEIPVKSIKLSGVGNITCHGETNNVNVMLSGSGNINLFDMEVSDADVKLSGTGNIHLYVTNYLDVSISGMGNVYYKGDPDIHSSITGVGQVVNSN